MKSWLWNGMLAAAITLPALSGVARAQITDKDGCSDATLKGDYAFALTNLTTQNFVVGITQFDGKGNLTQIDYPGNGLLMTPPLPDFRMGQTGTYEVRADCTGTGVINLNLGGSGGPIVHFVFVISNGGRSIHQVAGPTRSDYWKVRSDQEN
jgi:hypothetical protein